MNLHALISVILAMASQATTYEFNFTFLCTGGRALEGPWKICDGMSEHRQDCQDGSDVEFCSGGFSFFWRKEYNGCFSYEGGTELRIVPCEKCICFSQTNFNCMQYTRHQSECTVCLTDSSVPGGLVSCGHDFEASEDFRHLIRDPNLNPEQKSAIMQNSTWTCRDDAGALSKCGKNRRSEGFLLNYRIGKRAGGCLFGHFWKWGGEPQICVREGYSHNKECPPDENPCGERCIPRPIPCHGQCSVGWTFCQGDNDTSPLCIPGSESPCPLLTTTVTEGVPTTYA